MKTGRVPFADRRWSMIMRPPQEEEQPPVPFAADMCLSSGFGLYLWPLQVPFTLSVGAELQLPMHCHPPDPACR